MIGSFLSKGLVLMLGYVYPAYDCYKTVEKNKPDLGEYRFWCQYWILLAMISVFERVADTFVSWLPMYSETKLVFIIYLWYPKTKGTTYVYNSFFKPYVTKHETEIDRNLAELRTRAGDMAFTYCQKALSYGQTRIFEILQYVALQSMLTRPAQQPQQQEEAPRARQPPVTRSRQPATRSQAPEPLDEEPISPTSSTSSSREEDDLEEDTSSSQGPSTSAVARRLPISSALKKSISMPVAPQSSSQSTTNKAEAMQDEPVPAKAGKPVAKSPEETVMEETIRMTRGRLRKTRSTVTK